MSEQKIILENLEPIVNEHGVGYSIQQCGKHWHVSVCLFLDDVEGPNGKTLDIRFDRSFETSQDALRWIEESGPFYGLEQVFVLNEEGNIITEWSAEYDYLVEEENIT